MARPRLYDTSSKFYFTGIPCKFGHVANRYSSNAECVECRKEKNKLLKDKQDAWNLKNKEYVLEKSKQRYQDNIEKERQRSRDKWLKNPDKVKETNKKWMEKHPKIGNFYAAKRRTNLKSRTPTWSNIVAIKELYRNCPNGYHVDHIIPLQGKLVSGLHVETNLQYLPSIENQRKFNKYEVI